MLEIFKTYPYPMPDMRSNVDSSAVLIPIPVEVQTQEHQQGPSNAETLSSLPLEARNPTTSSSQKGEMNFVASYLRLVVTLWTYLQPAHNRYLNVGLLILEELSTRLTMPLATREIFKTYPYPMPDMRSNVDSSAVLIPIPVEVQTQEHQQGPSNAETLSSLPLEARNPTTSSSQKGEVKQSELTTEATSASSQKDVVVKHGQKQTLGESSQQGVSIEKSIHPNAPCIESAPSFEHIKVYERRHKDGVSPKVS
ncbi:hypothetical protein AgCh_000632 [Apium graveolens]